MDRLQCAVRQQSGKGSLTQHEHVREQLVADGGELRGRVVE